MCNGSAFSDVTTNMCFAKTESPIECPLNLTDVTDPAGGNCTCLQHKVGKVNLARAVLNNETDSDGAKPAVASGRCIPRHLLKRSHVKSPSP